MRHRSSCNIGWSGVLCVVCLLVTRNAFAQQQAPALPQGPLSLEQVLQLAEPHSESIAIARAGVNRAGGQQLQARSGLLPQLSVSAGYDRTLASEFQGLFSAPTNQCAPFALNQQVPLDARVAEIERAIDCGAVGGSVFGGSEDDGLGNLPFGRRNIVRATLTFSQNLYSGGRNRAQIDVANAGRETASLNLTTARAQLLFDATQAYYDAVLSDRLVAIAGATLEQANATLRQAQAGLSAGTQPEFEVLRARVTRDNQTPIIIRQRVNREVALLRLKQLLDLPPTYDLRLADSLTDETLAPSPVFAAQVAPIESAMTKLEPTSVALSLDAPLPDRVVVDEAATTVKLREAALRLAEAQKHPILGINSSYQRVGYPSGLTFGSLRTNWTIGISGELPILTGGRLKAGEMTARADLEESRQRLQQTQELAALDTRSAAAELLAARAAWEASAGTVQQATRAYEIADVRYRAGVSTQLELSDSRLLLQQAEANRAQAARDLQVARARIALLPGLPLGSTTGTAPQPQRPAQPQAPADQQPGTNQLRTASVPGSASQFGTR
jgi:outer membrane protein TolC